jgi:hypothetical protein
MNETRRKQTKAMKTMMMTRQWQVTICCRAVQVRFGNLNDREKAKRLSPKTFAADDIGAHQDAAK